jgi:hypothetical protein
MIICINLFWKRVIVCVLQKSVVWKKKEDMRINVHDTFLEEPPLGKLIVKRLKTKWVKSLLEQVNQIALVR